MYSSTVTSCSPWVQIMFSRENHYPMLPGETSTLPLREGWHSLWLQAYPWSTQTSPKIEAWWECLLYARQWIGTIASWLFSAPCLICNGIWRRCDLTGRGQLNSLKSLCNADYRNVSLSHQAHHQIVLQEISEATLLLCLLQKLWYILLLPYWVPWRFSSCNIMRSCQILDWSNTPKCSSCLEWLRPNHNLYIQVAPSFDLRHRWDHIKLYPSGTWEFSFPLSNAPALVLPCIDSKRSLKRRCPL